MNSETLDGNTPLGKRLTVMALVAISIALGAYWLNPAIALFGCMATRLALELNPVPRGSWLGKMSLQTAIVLLGFTLGADKLIAVSADYGWTIALYVLGTLGLGFLLALVFRDRSSTPTLITGGTAICGGTTIATLSPIINAKPQEFAVAMALVFLLNAFALLTFPWLGEMMELSQEVFGAWVALAIHDTSSVVATASLYGVEAQEVATTVKLGRTLWLIPLAFVASIVFGRGGAKLRVPLFVLLFVAAAFGSQLLPLTGEVESAIVLISKLLLVVALAMVGLDIDRATLRSLSPKGVLFGVLLWLIVAPVSLLLVLYL